MAHIQQRHALAAFLHPFYPFILLFLTFGTARCQQHCGCMVSVSEFQATALDGSLVTEGFSNTLFHFFKIKYRCYKLFVILYNTFTPKLVITLGNG